MKSCSNIIPIFALAFLLCPLCCFGQVKSIGGSKEPAKQKTQSTITEGSTKMAGASTDNDLSETLEFSTKSIADKIPTGRFLKEKRSGSDFVGTDAGERQEFVGAQGASGATRVRSATSGLRIERSREANISFRAATERRNAMYDPRLVVAFRVNHQSPRAIQVDLQRRLLDSRHLKWAGPVSVAVRGDTAVLTGMAASQRDREMAEMVLLFEPGIAKVENLLRVPDENRQSQPATDPQPIPEPLSAQQPQSYPEYRPRQ